MTTGGEQQEAVTRCGHEYEDGSVCWRPEFPLGRGMYLPHVENYGHPFIPAPVVPSDGPRTFRLRALSQGGEGKA